jgi:hypothetical protein
MPLPPFELLDLGGAVDLGICFCMETSPGMIIWDFSPKKLPDSQSLLDRLHVMVSPLKFLVSFSPLTALMREFFRLHNLLWSP